MKGEVDNILKRISMLLLALFVGLQAYAQSTVVTGTVSAADGMAILGANVVERDAPANGTITDENGQFTLRVSKPNTILTITYIGYQPKEVALTSQTNLKITLNESTELLEEVTVVAYGVQKKETLTGAISSVDNDELMRSPNASVANSLAGKVTGLSAVQTSGQPGAEDPIINIRGVGSLTTGGSSPLILVDGVERSFFQMDPNEIESVTVLKDASATAVFGVRGANGVILVTTRRGEEGDAKISFSSSFGATQMTRMVEMADSYTYALVHNEQSRNDGATEQFGPYVLDRFRLGDEPVLFPDIDWMEYMTNDFALQTQHNVSISGGNDFAKYFVSMGFFYQDGNFKQFGDTDNTYHYNRYNYRSNIDLNLTKTTTMKLGVGGIIGNQHTPNISSAVSSQWERINWSQPFAGAGLVDGKPTLGATYNIPSVYFPNIKLQEPFVEYYGNGFADKTSNTMNLDLSLNQKLDAITKGLSVEVKGAYNASYSYSVARRDYKESYIPAYQSTYENPAMSMDDPAFNKTLVYRVVGEEAPLGFSESSSRGRNWYLEGSLRYNRKFGDHNVGGLFLYNQSRKYYPSDFPEVPAGYVGYVGRVTYDYKSKYMAEFNIGRNGSENFAPDKRYGTFPALSLGYIITEEDFMKEQNVVNYLKLRASAGLVGNDNMSNNRFLYLPDAYKLDMSSGQTSSSSSNVDQWKAYKYGYNFGYDSTYIMPGAFEDSIGNPDVTWETAFKQNYGFDVNFLDNRLKISTDIFYEHRSNILLKRNVIPSLTGLSSSILPVVNMGEVKNQGYEIQAKWNDDINKDWSYWIDANLSYAHNTIINMDEVTPNEPYMARTGQSVSTLFGRKTDGMYGFDDFDLTYDDNGKAVYTLKEGYAVPPFGVQPGDVKYRDLNNDGVLDTDDVTKIGYSTRPEYTAGVNFGANYKNFYFAMNWVGVTNRTVFLQDQFRKPFQGEDRSLVAMLVDDRWTPATAETATMPRFSVVAGSHNYMDSDMWIRDGSYIRLKNMSVGYNFDTKVGVLADLGVKQLGIKFTGYNLLTFDYIKFVDPEATTSHSSEKYPITKTYSLGVNLTF